MELSANELSVLAEDYVQAREARLQKQREVDELEKIEKEKKNNVIELMREQKLSTIGGAHHIVSLKTDLKPVTSDWPALYAYIKENDAFDLLQKRLTETAVQLRWDEGISLPGVGAFPVDKLTIAKAKV